ncbi:MAG: response regulator transcription factor [Verrucomicrobia subdivision 3 bacterium]|nr:response regulator transcription factor [Limisphaerales bacterium]
MRKKRILIVDDHPMTRSGLVNLLDKQPDLEVCGEAGSPAEALAHIPRLKPDLLMTDITMPGRSGIEFIKDIRAVHPELPVLVLSMHDETVYAERSLRAGARGYIMKEVGGETLLQALRQVLGGSVYVSPRMSAQLLDALAGAQPRGSGSPIKKLTDREFEVFQLIGQGKSTRDVARQLHLSSKTVDVHRAHIKEKLGLEDSTSLIRYAVRWVESEKPGA